jgi:hypothetical protein
MLLNISDQAFKAFIDLYNAGGLSWDIRLAMEALEAISLSND